MNHLLSELPFEGHFQPTSGIGLSRESRLHNWKRKAKKNGIELTKSKTNAIKENVFSGDNDRRANQSYAQILKQLLL
jgi:hypothetical protein